MSAILKIIPSPSENATRQRSAIPVREGISKLSPSNRTSNGKLAKEASVIALMRFGISSVSKRKINAASLKLIVLPLLNKLVLNIVKVLPILMAFHVLISVLMVNLNYCGLNIALFKLKY
jgi:hypothetical protein